MEYENTWGDDVTVTEFHGRRYNMNLPDRSTKEILWRAFQPYGSVTDAYVAHKKDKRGNSFGFIRYVGVEDVGATVTKMNTVKIFEAKVMVSLAKYDKNHKRFMYTSKVLGEKVWKPKGTVPKSQQGYGGNASNSGSKTIAVDSNGSKYPLHCKGHSIHGIAKDLASLNNLQSILNNGGLYNYSLSYVGGLSVFLTLGNPENVQCSVNGEDLPVDRVATLRVTSEPVLLKDNSLFDCIGSLFGRVVQESNFSWLVSDNSDSSVKVLVPPGKRIDESVVVQWKEMRIVVWVTETLELWSPDLEDGSSSEDSGSDPDNNDDEDPDVDEVEEGEIRSDVPAGGNQVDNSCKKSSEVEKSPSITPEVGMHQEYVGMNVSADVSDVRGVKCRYTLG
ncbi:putative RNA recognition motif domain, nucleotide-binding alpha-beta plait domain superfamily [Helianthus anomalus]